MPEASLRPMVVPVLYGCMVMLPAPELVTEVPRVMASAVIVISPDPEAIVLAPLAKVPVLASIEIMPFEAAVVKAPVRVILVSLAI